MRLRESVYLWGRWSEGVVPRATGGGPRRTVRGMGRRSVPKTPLFGSADRLVQWCLGPSGAARGHPWLPQTSLIPVRRRGIPPDEPTQDIEWAGEPARKLLAANPESILHHTYDANQDRLLLQGMSCFRLKRTRLGAAYERFLQHHLQPGRERCSWSNAACGWPTLQLAQRHVFQHGASGSATGEEYRHGGPRVEAYLERYRSRRRQWDAPEPDGDRPEAEWGFEPALRADVERFAREAGYRVRRIVFEQPEDLSPLVADLYRWWYRRRRLPANRLMVESFIALEPWWAARTGSAPFWMVFDAEPSAYALQWYLDGVDPYDEMYMTLFSHGVESIGLVPIRSWQSILQRARRRGEFLGVDERAYPRDFAALVNYHADIPRKIAARYPLPGPLSLSQLDTFLQEAGPRYRVRWLDDVPGVA